MRSYRCSKRRVPAAISTRRRNITARRAKISMLSRLAQQASA
jgi:hypothetical protein